MDDGARSKIRAHVPSLARENFIHLCRAVPHAQAFYHPSATKLFNLIKRAAPEKASAETAAGFHAGQYNLQPSASVGFNVDRVSSAAACSWIFTLTSARLSSSMAKRRQCL
eukprot:IDg3594t1